MKNDLAFGGSERAQDRSPRTEEVVCQTGSRREVALVDHELATEVADLVAVRTISSESAEHGGWSTDQDASTFTSSERGTIQSIWQRVAEDYAPFNVNVEP